MKYGVTTAYEYNPHCHCPWCANGGKPTPGYWTDGAYGRVYQPRDGYGNEHYPPRELRFTCVTSK